MTPTLSPRARDGLFAISATMMFGYGSVFTLLAAIRERYGFDETAIGLIGGSGFAAGFVVQVALARLADRGHAVTMMRLGVATASLASFAMIFAESLPQWVGARVLLGVGSGCFGPAIRRLAVTHDPDRAGESLGRLAAFELTGFLIGPVLASLLYAWGGLWAPFVAVGVMLAAMSPLLSRLEIPVAGGPAPPRLLRSLVRRAPVQACLAAGVAFYLTVGVFEAIWAVFMTDLGASQLFIGLSLSAFTLPMIFIAPRAGELAQRRGPLRIATLSIGTATLAMFLYGELASLVALCAVLAVHSIADAFTMPAIQLSMARASGDEAVATGQGLLGATNLLVAASAAGAGGWIYDAWGAAVLWQGAGALMALLLGLAWLRGAELREPPRA